MSRSAQDGVDLFLCHTGANKDWVRELANRLEGESIDGRPLSVFFDEWDIAPGENILSRIEGALERARFVAVALSPALTHASWPTLEWQSQVYDDPTGKLGRILPLVVQKHDPDTLEPLEIPFALRLFRYLDFADPKRREASYQLLLARIRGERPGRGRPTGLIDRMAAINPTAGPEAAGLVDEVLLGNLFPAELPEWLYSDISTTSSYPEVRQALPGGFRTPFVLHEGRLYSFVPLDKGDNPFRPFLSGAGPRRERTRDVVAADVRGKHIVWLCNDALRQRCYELRLRAAPGHKDIFYPFVALDEERTFSWGKGPKLTLAKVNTGENQLGVHHAAAMKFIRFGQALSLMIEPGYYFTKDGYNPVEGSKAGRYSVRWGSKEGNWTVLRRMLMWPRILSNGERDLTLPTGGSPVKVSCMPSHGRANRGILGDDKDIQALLVGGAAGEIFEPDVELDAILAEQFESGAEDSDGSYSGDVFDDEAEDPADDREEQEESPVQQDLAL